MHVRTGGPVAADPATTVPAVAGLRSIGLLAGVSENIIQSLVADCVCRRYAAGQCIVAKESRDCDVYFILAGTVRVTAYSSTGRQVTYRELHGGEWFGELAAIDHRPRSADVVAYTEAMIASMHADRFVALLGTVPTLADALIRHLVGRVRELSDRLFDLSTLGVEARVEAELLRLARKAGVNGNAARIAPAPRHADIASCLGTYREQVSREVSRLSRMGVLGREPGALLVRDVSRLERLVGEAGR